MKSNWHRTRNGGVNGIQGFKIRRFKNTRNSAVEILFEIADKPRVTLQIQEKMVNQGLNIDQTKAGEALNVELAEMQKNHEASLRELQEEIAKAIRDRDIELQETLALIQQDREEQLQRLLDEQIYAC